MATLYIDIEELVATEDDAKALCEKIKLVVEGVYPSATVEIQEDSEYDDDPTEEDEAQ